MTDQKPIIAPRMPGIMPAERLLAGREIFDKLLRLADVVDFTQLSQKDQLCADEKYVDFYKAEDKFVERLYEGFTKTEWQNRRYPDRARHNFYIAALCNNDLALIEKILITGDWDERYFQTNLLVISNPDITSEAFYIRITDTESLGFEFTRPFNEQANSNFMILSPNIIMEEMLPFAHEALVHGLGALVHLGMHDDIHGYADGREDLLRAAVAGLFKKMPEDFRKEVVRHAVKSLEIFDQSGAWPDEYVLQKQKAYWHGTFVYAMQYLFDFNDPLAEPFVNKIAEQSGNPNSAFKLRDGIWKQIKSEQPHRIHTKELQQIALDDILDKVKDMETTPSRKKFMPEGFRF